jgi:hypothetical protein
LLWKFMVVMEIQWLLWKSVVAIKVKIVAMASHYMVFMESHWEVFSCN